MSINRFMIFGVFGALVSAVVGTAGAATTGTLNGSACQSTYDNTYPYGTKIFYSASVSSTDTVNYKYMTCPLPRVNGLSTTGLSNAYIEVNDPSNGNMWCQLYAVDYFGNTIATSGTKYSGGTGQRVITFGNIATSSAWGNYYIFCVMPPGGSTIYSYQWVER